MVRLIRVVRRGQTVWVEAAPARCPDGHDQLVPTWHGCPECGEMVRQWPCRADGCTAPVQIDDEHVHGGQR